MIEKIIIIKTEKNIGKFLDNSFIDGTPLRQVTEKELKTLSINDYELLVTDGVLSKEEFEKKI